MNWQLDYKDIGGFESFGDTALGLRIEVGGDLPKDMDHEVIWNAVYKAKNLIEDALRERIMLENPDTLRRIKAEREEILGLFPEGMTIYVEETPNEYSDSYYYKVFPWFIVTTPKGRIKIGWRKRVINIEWKETFIKKTGSEMFPTESTDMGTYYIHAWSPEKAKEYLKVLLS